MFSAKNVLASAIWAALAMLNPAQADDTEIYMDSLTAGGGATEIPQPKVMLILDYRSNLGSSYCSSLDQDCKNDMNSGLADTDPLLSDFLLQSDGVTPIPNGTAINELDVLRMILRWLFSQLDGFDVGFMINHDSSNSCEGPGQTNCSNGAYILNGFTDIGNSSLLTKLDNVRSPSGGSGAHTFQAKEAYFELYRYLNGGGVYNGHNGFKDYGSTTDTMNLDHSDNRDGDGNSTVAVAWDASIESGANYISPYDNGQNHECTATYAVTLFEGVTNQDDDSDGAIDEDMADVAGYYTGRDSSIALADVVSWMSREDTNPTVDGEQNVTFYFVADGRTNQAVSQAVTAAGTPLIDWDSPAQMAKKLLDVFRNIAVRSSTLVASSVPVNVFNRSDIQGDVYMAVFEVDDDALPSWPGNLKKFRIGEVTETVENTDGTITEKTELRVLDVNGNEAISSEDGRIAASALSYWTDPDNLRAVNPDRADEEPDATKDGRSVTRGGAGHKIAGVRTGAPGLNNSDVGARQMFLDPAVVSGTAAGGNSLVELRADYDLTDATDINSLQPLKALMNLPAIDTDENGDDQEAVNNLLWLRGYDVESDLNEYRNWLLADVLHSKPLAINYGSRDVNVDGSPEYDKALNPDIRIFMGTNDGFMRQFKNTAAGTDTPSATSMLDQLGTETWSFMPRELLDNVYTLRKNLAVAEVHPYGVDGAAAAFVIDNNSDGAIDHRSDAAGGCSDTSTGSYGVGSAYCDKAYIYFGLRRGGNSYYGLDVSNPDEAPSLLWRIDNTTSGFEQLGLSFSSPKVGWVKYTADGNATPVVIFAGGYYGGWSDSDGDGLVDSRVGKDDLSYTATADAPDAQGAAIYIVHARTGELIWKVEHGATTANVSPTEYNHADMHDSIPSEVATYDADGNGIIDRLYVGDTGGVVWRVDLGEGTSVTDGDAADDQRVNWFATRMASLGSDLRFFHRPDVVSVTDNGVRKDLVVMGSGDRAHPKSDTSTDNLFFVLKDNFVASGDATVQSRTTLSVSDLENITDSCVTGSEAGCSTDNLLSNGWVLDLEAGDAEKNLGSPVVVEGKVLFTSYLPSGSGGANSCSADIGESLLYVVSLADGAAVYNLSVGNFEGLPNAANDRYLLDVEGIGSDPVAVGPKHVLTPGGNFVEASGFPRWDVYWREIGVDPRH
nr:PilC/PilY family type IV pilus protein [Aestuariicella hydrocarbonica]